MIIFYICQQWTPDQEQSSVLKMERIRLNGGGHTSPKLIVDTKCLPVSLNKSSPPSKSSDVDIPHQIIRPTPRRAIDISAVDNLRFVQVGAYLDLLVFWFWIS